MLDIVATTTGKDINFSGGAFDNEDYLGWKNLP
jgi:hypothetical protein